MLPKFTRQLFQKVFNQKLFSRGAAAAAPNSKQEQTPFYFVSRNLRYYLKWARGEVGEKMEKGGEESSKIKKMERIC